MNLRQINVVAIALQRSSDGRFLLAKRKHGEKGEGQWEFPGGKIELGETQQQALAREIQEELSFKIKPNDLTLVAKNLYDYPSVQVQLYLWLYKVTETPQFKLSDHDQVAWFLLSEIDKESLSPADLYFLDYL